MSEKCEKRVRWTIDYERIAGSPLFDEIMGLPPPRRGRRLLALAEIGFLVSRGGLMPQLVPTSGTVASAAPAAPESLSDGQYSPPAVFGDIIDDLMKGGTS